jgi:hypothetical protein
LARHRARPGNRPSHSANHRPEHQSSLGVSALSRSIYMSRRAMGRRFTQRGLPVPSHWLQIGRLLRVAIKLQNSDDNVFSVAYATRSSLSSASTPVPTHARRGGSRPSDGLILPNPHTALQPADARGSARQNVLPSRSGASPRAAARGHGAEGLPLGKHQVQMFTGGRKQYGYEVSPVKLPALAQKTSPRYLTGGRAELIGVW